MEKKRRKHEVSEFQLQPAFFEIRLVYSSQVKETKTKRRWGKEVKIGRQLWRQLPLLILSCFRLSPLQDPPLHCPLSHSLALIRSLTLSLSILLTVTRIYAATHRSYIQCFGAANHRCSWTVNIHRSQHIYICSHSVENLNKSRHYH